MALSKEDGRICLYDNVRFILITLVVIGHCISKYGDQHAALASLNAFIYAFHMPAFIFLAGMFHKNERIIPKVVAYLCIYFMLKLGFFLGNILISEADDPFLVFSESNIPWFVFVLAGYTAVSYVLRDMDKRVLLLAAGMFGCFVGYDQTIGSFLALSRGFVFYPFYVLGEMYGRERLAAVSRRPVLRLAGGAVLAGWAIACFAFLDRLQPLTAMFGGSSPFPEQSFPWGPVWRILHYGLSLLLCFSIISVTPARRLPAVTVMGGRTLQIYFWHWPAVRILDALTGAGSLLCATGPGRAAWVLVGVAVTFVLGLRIFSIPTELVLSATGVKAKRPVKI